MKKPLFLESNDWHLESKNKDLIIEIVKHMIQEAKERGVENLVCGGDLLDSRTSQRLDVLMTLRTIFEMVDDSGLTLWVIHGNHDLTDYKSTTSFLTPFKDLFPSVIIIDEPLTENFDSISVDFIPFQDESVLVESINKSKGGDILFSHFELNGSKNNGKVADNRNIDKHLLSKWNKVFLGHYHDEQEVSEGIWHLSSLYQRGYGENQKKGFTLIYDDLSKEHIQTQFKPFKVVKYNIDDITPDVRKELLKEAKTYVNLRLTVMGSIEKVKSFKKSVYEQAGIDVKTQYDEVDIRANDVGDTIAFGGEDSVLPKFEEWCGSEQLDLERGKKYLEKAKNK
jgi:exonuclease SbcD